MLDKTDPVLYTVEDIKRIFKLGNNRAYELMRSSGFPTIRINRKMYVEKSKLEYWISANSGKSFKY